MFRRTEFPSFLVDSLVPIAVSRESQDRSFADMVRGAKADLQIAGPFSLTQLAPVQLQGLPIFVKQHSVVVESRSD